jgi:micrococcal nuclease
VAWLIQNEVAVMPITRKTGTVLALGTVVLSCLLACGPVRAKPGTSPFVAGPAAPSDGVGRITATVTKVVDGDTIDVDINGAAYKLRYIGMDCPELGSAGVSGDLAKKATDVNRELVGGKTVQLEKDISETDRYGRLLRYVYSGDLMVNAELVRLGFARSIAYPPDTRYQSLLASLQSEAKAAALGIWDSDGDVPLSNASTKGTYVGSKKSSKYHYPSCAWGWQIAAYNEVWFSSSEDARSKGYVPCKVCLPP